MKFVWNSIESWSKTNDIAQKFGRPSENWLKFDWNLLKFIQNPMESNWKRLKYSDNRLEFTKIMEWILLKSDWNRTKMHWNLIIILLKNWNSIEIRLKFTEIRPKSTTEIQRNCLKRFKFDYTKTHWNPIDIWLKITQIRLNFTEIRLEFDWHQLKFIWNLIKVGMKSTGIQEHPIKIGRNLLNFYWNVVKSSKIITEPALNLTEIRL